MDAVVVFLVVVGAVAGVSWLLLVVEWMGTLSFSRGLFGMGPVVFRAALRAMPRLDLCEDRGETATSTWRRVSPGCCLFRYRVRLFGATLHTPFLIKGVLRCNGASSGVEGRLPFFPLMFLAAWLVECTAGGVLVLTRPEAAPLPAGIGLLLLGWGFPAALCLLSIPYEIGRAQTALADLVSVLGRES